MLESNVFGSDPLSMWDEFATQKFYSLAHAKGVLANMSHTAPQKLNFLLITFLAISHNLNSFCLFVFLISVIGKQKFEIVLIKVLAISDNSEDILLCPNFCLAIFALISAHTNVHDYRTTPFWEKSN